MFSKQWIRMDKWYEAPCLLWLKASNKMLHILYGFCVTEE